MNSPALPRLALRFMAIILVLVAVGIGGVVTAQPSTGKAESPPHAAPPLPPLPLATCPPPSPTAIATPAFTPGPGCTARPRPTDLNADITVNGNTTTAVFTNRSTTCSYPIGLATYQRIDNNIDHQILFDYALAVIPPHSSLTLTVNNPPCAFQADAFWGRLIESFRGGVRYGQRLLDDRAGNGQNYCVPVCPTPQPVCPSPTPPVIVTPAFTPAPGCVDQPGPNVLDADISINGNTTSAVFHNHSATCSYRIGLATYRRFDTNIDHQELFDYTLAVIPPHSSLTLTVNNPPCAFQADAFWGDLIVSFQGGVRYGVRLLDDRAGNGQNYCVSPCATPSPVPSPTCPPAPLPTVIPPSFTPGPGCTDTPPNGALVAVITDHPNTTDALFTNHSATCSYRIGLATYKRYDNNIDHQTLYDYALAVIPPNSSLMLTVNNPPCAYQGDAFYGDLIVSFAGGVRYGPRRLDDTDGVHHDICPNTCATPTASPTAGVTTPTASPTRAATTPTASPTVTGTPPTATVTVTGTPPTNTPTATRPPNTVTPTGTARATTTAPPITGTVTPFPTPTRTTTGQPSPTRTGSATITSIPSVTTTPCCGLTGVITQFCNVTSAPSPTPAATGTVPPTATGTPPPTCFQNFQYQAAITSACLTAINATYFATLEVSNDDITYTPRATTAVNNITLVPGLNNFGDSFASIAVSEEFYRVRVTITLANNCGTFNFIAAPDHVCRCGGNNPPPLSNH